MGMAMESGGMLAAQDHRIINPTIRGLPQMRQEATRTDGSRRYRHSRLGGNRQEPTATDARRPQRSSSRSNTPEAPCMRR
jgi:hypothetical protein